MNIFLFKEFINEISDDNLISLEPSHVVVNHWSSEIICVFAGVTFIYVCHSSFKNFTYIRFTFAVHVRVLVGKSVVCKSQYILSACVDFRGFLVISSSNHL